MRERAELVGGTFRLDSASGAGTSVVIEIDEILFPGEAADEIIIESGNCHH